MRSRVTTQRVRKCNNLSQYKMRNLPRHVGMLSLHFSLSWQTKMVSGSDVGLPCIVYPGGHVT